MTSLPEGAWADLRTGAVFVIAPAKCAHCGPITAINLKAHNERAATTGERVYRGKV
jgi:hypothetical protein